MNAQDESQPAKPHRGIPAAVEARLKEVVRAFLAENRTGKSRGVLREDPEFVAWIGKGVGKNGETGDKRLDRLFKAVRAENEERAKRSRRARAMSARQDGAGSGAGPEQTPGSVDLLPIGAPTDLGQQDLLRLATQCLPQLDRSMAALVDEDAGRFHRHGNAGGDLLRAEV